MLLVASRSGWRVPAYSSVPLAAAVLLMLMLMLMLMQA